MDYIEPDDLKLYFGAGFQVTEYIYIHQPTIGEIIEYGENEYYQMVSTFCIIPSDIKSMLWDSGIDWEKISDFELFCLMVTAFDINKTRILFGDIDFSKFRMMEREENGEMVLFQRVRKQLDDGTEDVQDIIIDVMVYQKIVDFIRKLHYLHPNVEHSTSKKAKELLILLDRENHEKAKKEGHRSTLLPLVSGLLNSAEFKYKKSELKEVGIFEFYDSIARIQTIKSADALLKGCYGGFINTSGIDKNELNWLRDLSVDTQVHKGLMEISKQDAKIEKKD